MNLVSYITFILMIIYISHPLFSSDEMQGPLTVDMKKVAPKKIPTGDVLYDFFISRSRNNLHIVLCFSPVMY